MKRMFALLAWLPFAAAAASTPSILAERVEQAIQARVKAGEYPAMVLAVVDGDRSHVYGFGALADGKAPDADTLFQIGSVTKTFTATLLADAVGRGEVKLNTPVARLLPGWKIPTRDGKPITLGELASQYSGLPRLPGNLHAASHPQDPYAGYDAARLKTFLAGYTLPRDPGSGYEYSNLGFGLLGHALAQQTHMTYAALLEARILKPLGMTSTSAEVDASKGTRWAKGHDMRGKPAKPWHLGVLAGAGAIESTGADMLRYLKANMGQLGTPLVVAMRTAQTPRRDAGNDERIGLAWMTRHTKAGDILWHNGMTGGYASFIGFTADGERGVVVLTNIQQSVDDLGFAALVPALPLAPAHRQVHLSAHDLDAYTGEYRLAPNFNIRIFRKGEQLYAQGTGQAAFTIFASGSDHFFAKVGDIRLDFQRDAEGAVTSLVLHQNGHTSAPAPRAKPGAQASPRAARHAVKLDPVLLRQYVGRYRLAPGAVFDITLKGEQLMARLTGQPAFPIHASARDEFFYTVVDARLSFKRDKNGKVDALVLHQNGADQRARRLP